MKPGLIPSFFYDLISRTIPGGAIFAVGSLALESDMGAILQAPIVSSPALSGSALVMGVSVAVASYLIGQLLAPLADPWGRWTSRWVARRANYLQKVVNSAAEEHPADLVEFYRQRGDTSIPSLFVLYDGLRLNNPERGLQIAKTRAEYRMAEVLSVGLAITAVLHVAVAGFTEGTTPNVLAVTCMAIGCLLAARASAHLFLRFQQSVVHGYYHMATGPSGSE
jgi:hypothetical protein